MSQNVVDAVFTPAPFFCMMMQVTMYLREKRKRVVSPNEQRTENERRIILLVTHLKGRFNDCNSFKQESTMAFIWALIFSWLYLEMKAAAKTF